MSSQGVTVTFGELEAGDMVGTHRVDSVEYVGNGWVSIVFVLPGGGRMCADRLSNQEVFVNEAFNGNGLTYERWLTAATVQPSARKRAAWLRGEDPCDWRARAEHKRARIAASREEE